MARIRGQKRHDGRKRRTGLGSIVLFVMVICGSLVYKRVMLEQEEMKAEAAYEAALKDYEAEVSREEELSELEVYTQTKKFIEDMAREKFGLVYENEIVFQPETSD